MRNYTYIRVSYRKKKKNLSQAEISWLFMIHDFSCYEKLQNRRFIFLQNNVRRFEKYNLAAWRYIFLIHSFLASDEITETGNLVSRRFQSGNIEIKVSSRDVSLGFGCSRDEKRKRKKKKEITSRFTGLMRGNYEKDINLVSLFVRELVSAVAQPAIWQINGPWVSPENSWKWSSFFPREVAFTEAVN